MNCAPQRNASGQRGLLVGRKEGSVRRKTQRATERIDATKPSVGANRQATLGDRTSEFEFKRFAARAALREDLRSKPPAGIMDLSARVANVGTGLQTRGKCDEEMRDGSLDVGKIYWAGEKLRPAGARSGSN